MKKSKFSKKKVIVLLVIFVAVPLVIQLHWTPFYQIAKVLTPGDKSDWLGFWGSYLGFVPAGLVTYVALEFQFERQAKIDARNAEDQLKKQKHEFLFEKNFEDLTRARELAMSIWLNSSEITYLTDNIEMLNDEGNEYIFNEILKLYVIIKKDHNEFATLIEGQMHADVDNNRYKKVYEMLKKARPHLTKIRNSLESKNKTEISEFSNLLKLEYTSIKEELTFEKASIIREFKG